MEEEGGRGRGEELGERNLGSSKKKKLLIAIKLGFSLNSTLQNWGEKLFLPSPTTSEPCLVPITRVVVCTQHTHTHTHT